MIARHLAEILSDLARAFLDELPWHALDHAADWLMSESTADAIRALAEAAGDKVAGLGGQLLVLWMQSAGGG